MKLWLTAFILGISGIGSIISPGTVQRIGVYPSQEVLIRIWGIYALGYSLSLMLNDIDTLTQKDKEMIVPGTMLACFIMTIYIDYTAGLCNGTNWCYYVVFAIILNILGVAETVTYFMTDSPFITVKSE